MAHMAKTFLVSSRSSARMGLLVFVVMTSLVGLVSLSGCANNNQESAAEEMLNYYNIEAVYRYHNELSGVLSDSAKALVDEDEKLLDGSLEELDRLCDALTDTTDVPESLLAYHGKMLETADAVKQYAKAIRADDFDAAADKITVVQKKIDEAKELLPDPRA